MAQAAQALLAPSQQIAGDGPVCGAVRFLGRAGADLDPTSPHHDREPACHPELMLEFAPDEQPPG